MWTATQPFVYLPPTQTWNNEYHDITSEVTSLPAANLHFSIYPSDQRAENITSTINVEVNPLPDCQSTISLSNPQPET